MFNILISEHIKSRKEEKGLTYETISAKAPVPLSTLHAYAQGTVKMPKDDVLIRIFAVLGDGPEVIQQLRKKAAASTIEETQILSSSTDQERMEAFATLMRAHMSAVLEEYRLQSSAQQTEIIQHADARVETERQRFKARADEVLRQCNAEVAKTEAICAEKIAMAERHSRELLSLKDEQIKSSSEENEKVRAYLRIVVRNLTIALIAVSAFAVVGLACLGGYAFYAYQTFDVEDPTRGLFRGGASLGPIVLTMLVLTVAAAIALAVFFIIKKRRPKTAEK